METYLHSRLVNLPPSSDILFHSSLTEWDSKIGRPAMVAIVRRPDTGETTGGVHRTYLADDGMGKADISKPKMMLGPCDGAVMLMPMGADGSLGIGEGIESSLAAHKLFGIPTWAALSTSGLRNFVFPPGLKRLAIFADRGNDGEAAAFHLRDRAMTRGIEANVTLPRSDDDFAKDLALGLRQDDAAREVVIPPPRRLSDIAASVDTLTRPHDAAQMITIMRGMIAARLSTTDRESIFKAIKRKTGVGVVESRDLFQKTRKEVGIAARMIGPAPAWIEKVQSWDNGEPKPILYNVLIGLREDDPWRGVLGRNEFTDRICVRRSPPWPNADWSVERDWTDDDLLKATEWVQAVGVSANPSTVFDAIASVANENRFHPVRDWLEQLVWDEIPRLDNWLNVHCGADPGRYTKAVGSRFLISAVARIDHPGCKVDCAPILEGEQGLGKSTALRVLFDPWFTDEIADLGSKDSAMQLAGVWCIELAELDAMTRAEVPRLKAFITRTNDRYRPPYGRTVVDVPRQCVFAGSVNDSEYLRDPTGERRFWPVKCASRIDPHKLHAVRNQLWAEAVVRFDEGEKWWLHEPDLVADATEEQADRATLDAWYETISEYLVEAARHPVVMTDGVSIGSILTHAIGKSKDHWVHRDTIRVGACLQALKWTKRQLRVNGTRERLYFPPAAGDGEPDYEDFDPRD